MCTSLYRLRVEGLYSYPGGMGCPETNEGRILCEDDIIRGYMNLT